MHDTPPTPSLPNEDWDKARDTLICNGEFFQSVITGVDDTYYAIGLSAAYTRACGDIGLAYLIAAALYDLANCNSIESAQRSAALAATIAAILGEDLTQDLYHLAVKATKLT